MFARSKEKSASVASTWGPWDTWSGGFPGSALGGCYCEATHRPSGQDTTGQSPLEELQGPLSVRLHAVAVAVAGPGAPSFWWRMSDPDPGAHQAHQAPSNLNASNNASSGPCQQHNRSISQKHRRCLGMPTHHKPHVHPHSFACFASTRDWPRPRTRAKSHRLPVSIRWTVLGLPGKRLRV